MSSHLKSLAFQILKSKRANAVLAPLLKGCAKIGIYSDKGFVFPAAGTLPVCYRGQPLFKMRTDGSDTIAGRAFFWGVEGFEPEMARYFPKLVENAQAFFDIGANTGFYSLLAAQLNPKLKVWAFEPVPSIRRVLEENIRLNHLDQVTVEGNALGDRNGHTKFYLPRSIRIATGGSVSADHRTNTETIQIEIKTLDKVVEENSIRGLDLIKIDTESTEAEVLRGGINTIAEYKPVIFCEILTKKSGTEVFDILSPLGYQFLRLDAHRSQKINGPEDFPPSQFANFLIYPEKYDTLIKRL